MRVMQNSYGKVNVTEHIILRNGWEYYVTDQKHDEDIVLCVVMGFETEMGDVSLSEIKPYILMRTKNLTELMPCEGWRWVA